MFIIDSGGTNMRYICMLSTLALLVMALNLSAIAAKGDPPQWTFDDKDAKNELKSWVDKNQF